MTGLFDTPDSSLERRTPRGLLCLRGVRFVSIWLGLRSSRFYYRMTEVLAEGWPIGKRTSDGNMMLSARAAILTC